MAIKNSPQPSRSRLIGNILLLIGGILLFINIFFPQIFSSGVPRVPYSLFIHQVQEGEVTSAYVGQNEIRYQTKAEGETPATVYSTTPIFDLELPKLLESKGVEFAAAPPPRNGWFTSLLGWVIPPLIFVAVFQFFASRGAGGGGPQGALSIGKSKAKVYVEGDAPRITFDDVAGVEEAKAELVEVVDFLKSPERYKAIGAKIPKGVLLVGPPGTGKTLLSKAVAGEAGVPFFSISGSEFVELFVGVGSARVRDLFEQAKKQAPCIVFIDELDAIGKSRSSNGFYGGNDEREQTLNQLLTEMDGFSNTATVIVLAATNRPESLDAALLRPGRFDRQVLVDRPDLSGREAILKIHAQAVKLGDDVDLHAIATRTPGFAGADLANLVNEAALLAARNQRQAVAQADFAEAIERLVAGLEKKSRVLSDREKEIVAYHEVGHAIVGYAMPGSSKVEKISIIPRGMAALGYTLQLPTEDRFLLDEAELRGQIATLLGGRSAEEIIFGSITTGASNDLQRATDLAERMVRSYGMSKVLGPLAFEEQRAMFLGEGAVQRSVSEETAQAIDREVKEIVETAHHTALDILKANRDLLETISKKLLEKEVIEGAILHELLGQIQAKEPQVA
ncbi:ATP-dependent zinc metalloprotease FtsH4 [Thermosynechococcaceae cyanobacterium BACA0444]|uniref:ATP-dependent zinc metalloprotease FtsH n=1 Tax=Pseudocalidococcus azoricus BACA0444 TaxID=2918990 RepID=A0AAE4FRB1_9CYAN|nr:ATP-dependent zinc metalloprotease FtsH4 [Pseudocalidococcus azoricus]MDS3860720.1 ATP-dependent zinc metalloprotease FtsH4 [Pseudocalidococcus azoricus BACA0444]